MTSPEFDSKCTLCSREYRYTQKAGHAKTICNSCMVNNRRFQRKERCVEYKGGCCVRCGYHKSTRALSFHHVDATKKDFSIGGAHSRQWESIKAELDKCLLLCANCHMEVHEQLELDNKLSPVNISNKRKPTEPVRCACGKPTSAVQCKSCYDANRPTKITWPDASELQRLVWEMPCSKLALTLGISDKAIEKQCKKLGITKPPRGYWACINAPDNKGT
jgi:ribosomal protein L30E